MTATIRLFTIEARRSTALWFVLPLTALVSWGTLTTMRPDGTPTQWARSSIQLGMMCIVASILMCGVGAWIAGRDRRRRTEELLATVPRPVALLDISILASAVFWGLAACLLAILLVFAIVYREATWSGPDSTPIIVGLLTVVAGTGVGYAGGVAIRSRFAAPLMAVVFASLVLLIGTRSTAIAYLSPLAMDPRGISPYDVFYQAPGLPLGQMALWLAGVACCAWTATALWRRRSWPAWGALILSLAIAGIAGSLATQAFVHPPWERIYAGQPLREYQPVCVERSIPICVHPVYETWLEEYADLIGALVEPVVGVPGGPLRVEQLPAREGWHADGTLEIIPSQLGVAQATYDLVRSPGGGFNSAQQTIAVWLISRVQPGSADSLRFFSFGNSDASIDDAVARFSALDPDAQREWLVTNFQDLRRGLITIDEIP